MQLDVPFTISNPWAFTKYGLPLRCSVPLPKGAVHDPAAELCLSDDSDRDVGAQWRVLSRRRDGSVRFALMDYAAAELPGRESVRLRLRARTEATLDSAEPRARVSVRESADALTVDTGRLSWTFSRKRFSFAESVRFAGREWIGNETSDLLLRDDAGQVYRASEGDYSISVEEPGPWRVVVLIRGTYRNPLRKFMDYWVRFHFVAGGSQVLMMHHLRNREPGREGRDIRRSALTGGLALQGEVTHRLLHTARTVGTIQVPIEVPENVDIDVGEWEISLRNEASLREDPNDICWSLKHGKQLHTNRRCAPLVDIYERGTGGMLLKLAMPHPEREFPMRLGADRASFEVDFFPDTGEPYHLNEGMGKTRDVLIHFHDDALSPMDLIHDSDNVSYPGVVGVRHEVYRQAEFADVHLALVKQPNKYPLLERKIEFMKCPGDIQNKQAIKSHPLLGACRGWRDFGDYVGLRGPFPEAGVRQFMNNEEDYIYCAMLDAWRTGRPYDGRDTARHLMDIDYIDYSSDPGRDGAVCPHSTNHTDGEVYPSHQWCQGLLYYYLGTGDEEALRIARRIGDCLCWYITGPRQEATRASGRETAWPLLSLAALYEVTGEDKYRETGMVVIEQMYEVIAQHGRMVWEYPPGSGIHNQYMMCMTFNGVWDLYAATGDERVLELWKQLTGPVVDSLEDPDSFGYVHFRNQHLMWPDLTVLVRWFMLTGEERYIELGRNGLRLVLAGCPEPLIQSDSIFAMGYRHFILFLKLADERGMIDDGQVTLVW